MSKILDTLDELNKGRDFIKAASLAIHGCGLDSNELNALDRILGEAQEALWVVGNSLSELLNAERERQGKDPVATDQ